MIENEYWIASCPAVDAAGQLAVLWKGESFLTGQKCDATIITVRTLFSSLYLNMEVHI